MCQVQIARQQFVKQLVTASSLHRPGVYLPGPAAVETAPAETAPAEKFQLEKAAWDFGLSITDLGLLGGPKSSLAYFWIPGTPSKRGSISDFWKHPLKSEAPTDAPKAQLFDLRSERVSIGWLVIRRLACQPFVRWKAYKNLETK